MIDESELPSRDAEVLEREMAECRRTEAALRENEARYRRIMETSQEGIWILDAEARIYYVNQRTCEMLGYSAAAMIGRPLFDFMDEEARAIARQHHESRRHGMKEQFDLRLRRQDGTLMWGIISTMPILGTQGEPEGSFSMVTDITERRQAEAALRESEEKFRATFDQAAVGIAQVAMDGRWLRVNQKLCDILGYSPEEMAQRTFQDITHKDDLDTNLIYLQQALAGQIRTYTLEKRYVRKDGGLVWANLTVALVRDVADQPKYFISVIEDITERKRAETELKKSQVQLAEAQRIAHLGNWEWNIGSNTITWSDEMFHIYGLKDHEFEATYEAFLERCHPEDKARVHETIQQACRDHQPFIHHYRICCPGGAVRILDLRGSVVTDDDGKPIRMFGICQDVTERKQTEEDQRFVAEASKLLASSLDYETTLGSVARLAVPHLADWCIIDLVEGDGSLQRLAVAHSDSARAELVHLIERPYGLLPQEKSIVTKVLSTGRPEFFPEVTDAMLATLARDAENLQRLREVGMKSYMCVPLIAREKVLGAISLVAAASGRRYTAPDLSLAQDLAARAAVAVDNARLYRAAQQAQQEAEAANRAKDEFLATLSHELRTPLTVIMGWVSLMRSGKLDAETMAQALETVERSTKTQAELIGDILDVSRIAIGKLRMTPGPVDLTMVVKAALATMRPAAEAKQVQIEAAIEPAAGLISGDPHRLQQVLGNLLANALKFTPADGSVRVLVKYIGSHAEISVSDSGQGISAEFLPHVFERFRQADSTSTREHKGLGLGLSIVKHLVELHGGSVQASSPGEGQGAAFIVTLPLLVETLSRAVQPDDRASALNNKHHKTDGVEEKLISSI